MKMKVIVKCGIAALMVLSAAGVYGQTPEKVTLDKDYYQHGFNSNGANQFDVNNKAIVKAQEVRDSVTVTSTMKYFVLPDATANPDFKYDTPANAADFTKVLSTFTWGFRRNGGTPLALGELTGTPTDKHIILIKWNDTGVDTLRVKENPVNGCTGAETKIPVAVISKPTITFNQVGTPLNYNDGACYTQAQVTAGINYSFPVAVTSQSSQIKVDYSIVFTPLSGSPVTTTATGVSVNSGVLPLTLQNTLNLYGTYAVTIIKVTDRIARKSGVESTGSALLTSGGSATFTYNVMKPVETGPIYRLPNFGDYNN